MQLGSGFEINGYTENLDGGINENVTLFVQVQVTMNVHTRIH